MMDHSSRSRAVLVTGGSGFVGKAVLAELLRHDYHIIATTTRPRENLAVAGARWVTWDATRTRFPRLYGKTRCDHPPGRPG